MDLNDYLKEHPCRGFRPMPVLIQGGRALMWYWEDVPHYSEPIHCDDRWVGSVHRANSDRRAVGVTIHAEALRGLDRLQLELEDKRDGS